MDERAAKRVVAGGGTSGRSGRLEQGRQCVHNLSRNAHGRLYRQLFDRSSYSLSLSLLGFCTSDPASIGRFGSRVGVHVGRVDGDSAGWTGLWQPCETASRGVDASFSTCACEGPKVATHREAMAAAAVPPAPVPRWTFYECPASGCSSQAFKRANLTSWETEDCGNVCVVVVLVAFYC